MLVQLFPAVATSVVTLNERVCGTVARRSAKTPFPCSCAAADDDDGHLGLA